MSAAAPRCWLAAPVLALALAIAAPASAQLAGLGGGAADGEAASAPTLPDPLTREAIRDLLAGLDDGQVRNLLLQRLSAEAERRAAELARRQQRELTTVAADYAEAFAAFLVRAVAATPRLADPVAAALASFAEQRQGRGSASFFAMLAVSLGAGLAAAAALWLPLRYLMRRVLARRPGAGRRQGLAFLAQAAAAAAFLAAGCGAAALMAGTAGERATSALIVTEIARTWLVAALAWAILAPGCAQARLVAAEDGPARRLALDVVLLSLFFNAGFGFLAWIALYGVPLRDVWLGFWINLAFHLLAAAVVWRNRAGLRTILLGWSNDGIDRWFAAHWPALSILLLGLHWLAVGLLAASSGVEIGTITSMALTLAVLIGAPAIDRLARALARLPIPHRPGRDAALLAADEETRAGLARVFRVAAAVLGVAFVLGLWQVDIEAVAAESVGARLAGALLGSLLIVALAYGAWQLVRTAADRRIAIERVALGLGDASEEPQEGEGGGAGPRLGTLLPLVKAAAKVAIVTIAALAVLGEMGVNILPLLAGASVAGLAIGFGAQTLVKDVVSGAFFLFDDAFRRGEYVDIGEVKGTVEKISIRSMQLRHHRGPLNTVPFGDIRHVTNYSRDWAIMKLPLRLTYDTDAEKVRKMIKKLGQELLADPEFGPMFLQPLKSQGVVQMEDSAQIMAVKFMTRPGDQWMLRRVVFARIRDLFEANGIRFANREVTVRLGDDEKGDGTGSRALAGAAARIATEPQAPPPGGQAGGGGAPR